MATKISVNGTVYSLDLDSGHTPIPNDFYDKLFPALSSSGLRVFLFVWRKTRGWQKTADQLSITQIMRGTGLGNQATVNGIKNIKNVIRISNPSDGKTPNTFDISALLNSPLQKSHSLDTPGSVKTGGVTPPKITHTKERLLNKTTTNRHGINIVSTRAKDKKGGGGDKPPPSAVLFHKLTQMGPPKILWQDMDKAIGSDQQNLDRFEEIIKAWIGCGWSPKNLTGMLEFYNQGNIPGKDGYRNGQHKKNGKGTSGPGGKTKTSGNDYGQEAGSFDPKTGEIVLPDGTRRPYSLPSLPDSE